MGRLLSLFILFLHTSLMAKDFDWQLNDVSFLVPFSAPNSVQYLLAPNNSGHKGELLSLSNFKLVPQLIPLPGPEKVLPILRVVAIRIDPCFLMQSRDQSCQRQIRLVWQPIRQNNAIDAAVHTFYQLSNAEFDQFIQELKKLKSSRPEYQALLDDQPLGLHPVMVREGLTGPYWTNLRQLILHFIGDANLVRMTFMNLKNTGFTWQFGGFDFRNAKVTEMQIPLTNQTTQLVSNSDRAATEFSGVVAPLPRGQNGLRYLSQILIDSRSTKIRLKTNQAKLALDETIRIENPLKVSPLTMDCVSCHASMSARHWLNRNYPELLTWQSPFKFQSDLNLENVNVDAEDTALLRAFGFVRTRPLISQRVINETAQVVKALSEQQGQ